MHLLLARYSGAFTRKVVRKDCQQSWEHPRHSVSPLQLLNWKINCLFYKQTHQRQVPNFNLNSTVLFDVSQPVSVFSFHCSVTYLEKFCFHTWLGVTIVWTEKVTEKSHFLQSLVKRAPWITDSTCGAWLRLNWSQLHVVGLWVLFLSNSFTFQEALWTVIWCSYQHEWLRNTVRRKLHPSKTDSFRTPGNHTPIFFSDC